MNIASEDRIYKQLAIINTDIKRLIADVASLKVKSGLWGGIAGLLAAVPMTILILKLMDVF